MLNVKKDSFTSASMSFDPTDQKMETTTRNEVSHSDLRKMYAQLMKDYKELKKENKDLLKKNEVLNLINEELKRTNDELKLSRDGEAVLAQQVFRLRDENNALNKKMEQLKIKHDAEQKMKLLEAQQPTFMWGGTLGFYNTDESMRMAEYDSPGECWYDNVHSVHASKEAADNLCAKFNRFIKDCEVNKKIDPWHFHTKLEFAEVIEIKPGERILAEGKDYDPFYDDFRKCGIEALWKQFCLQDCSE